MNNKKIEKECPYELKKNENNLTIPRTRGGDPTGDKVDDLCDGYSPYLRHCGSKSA